MVTIKKAAMSAMVAMGIACAGAGAMAQAPAAGAKAKPAKAAEAHQFIEHAIQGNLAEIKLGKLGEDKGRSDAIREFAKRMVSDHMAANGKATAAAQAAGVTPPKQPSAQQSKTYQRLSKLSGTSFDRQFIARMVQDHEKAIAEYEQAGTTGPIGTYAKNALPVLHAHLEMAKKIEKSEKSQSRPGAPKPAAKP